mgnify:CR=1 FL=1|jgi:CMP-N,N'-diacetyllegionaminic acid synthase|tara:strand:+ start:2031 stop:2738 length:708 start_codon:yes stop_codon:yes gene_type:complete
MNVLCTICARGGSKGVKNKNIKNINGKPLISYSINQALKSNIFNEIVVSTDSRQISKISKKFKAESWFLRPKNLSNDKSEKIYAIRHALITSEKYFNKKYDYIVDLDASSPLRSIEDIKKSFKKFINTNSSNLVTLCESRKNPYFNMIEIKKNVLKKVKKLKKKVVRRQDAPKVYEMNASIYIWSRKTLLSDMKIINNRTSYYIMPYNRSIDIDNIDDFNYVNHLMKRNDKRIRK